MTIFSCSYSPLTRHPMEDYVLAGASGTVFAVADGVTKDWYSESEYPDKSGPAECARIFCRVVGSLLEANGLQCNDTIVAESFTRANAEIKLFNAHSIDLEKQDFLNVDLFGTVGVAAYVCPRNHLHYGCIGDCRILVLRNKNEAVLFTPDGVESVRKYLKEHRFGTAEERRVFVRSKLRNKRLPVGPNGLEVGYGVLTGEAAAETFCIYGKGELRENDQILLFSDGVTPCLENREFNRLLQVSTTQTNEVNCNSIVELWKRLSVEDNEKFGDDMALVSCVPLE